MNLVTAVEPQQDASLVSTLEAPLVASSRPLALSTDVVGLRKRLAESGMIPGEILISEEIEPFSPAG